MSLNVWKLNKEWHAKLEVTGADAREALLRLLDEVERAEGFLHGQLDDDPCGGRDCAICEIGGCDPEEAQDEWAQGVEVEFNTTPDEGAESTDDGQPSEQTEWQDFDPDC
jgi:hypothetical protein